MAQSFKIIQLKDTRNNAEIYPTIAPESVMDNSIEEDKLSYEVQNKLNFYDSIPSSKNLFNPIYRINSDWFSNGYANQGTLNETLSCNNLASITEVNEGVGLKVQAGSKYVEIVSNMTIPLTATNYKENMTYLNYCKMGSLPNDDVELIVSTSMQNSADNRYHVLVWEKTNLARADWKINRAWSGAYYINEEDGGAVELTEKDLNSAFLVTVDLSHYKFTLYTFDGTTVTKRGVATVSGSWSWQGDNYYIHSNSSRRQMGIGQVVFGGENKNAIFYESMIWNRLLTEEEVNTVFNQLKYYKD